MAELGALIGSWRMVSWTREGAATGEVMDTLGPDPIGYIAYHADGGHGLPAPPLPPTFAGWSEARKATLHETTLAYVASYTFAADHVEAAWKPELAGRRVAAILARWRPAGHQRRAGFDPTTGEDAG